MIVDTHQHLIYPDKLSYPWINKTPQLKGAWELEAYWNAVQDHEVEQTIFMEVDVKENQNSKETSLLCKLADNPNNRIGGVIAGARPENEGFGRYLEKIRHPKLKGIRRVLHVVPNCISQSTLFRENIGLLEKFNLIFDVCVRADQLPLAKDLIQSCPDVSFILDHCGNPDIGAGFLQPWKESLIEVASFSNVACKISGIVVNCGKMPVNLKTVKPYLDTVLETFGPDRLLFGGDWPVCTLATSLSTWIEIVNSWSNETLSESEKRKLFSDNAKRIYRII